MGTCGREHRPVSPSEHAKRHGIAVIAVTTVISLFIAAPFVRSAFAEAIKLLPSGSQTMLIRVTFRSGGKTSFVGKFAGGAITGEFEKPDPAMARTLCSDKEAALMGTTFTFSGIFDSRPYSFSGCVDVRTFTYHMAGHVGSLGVSGSAVWKNWRQDSPEITLPFNGRVGSQSISGTATLTISGSGPNAFGTLVSRFRIT